MYWEIECPQFKSIPNAVHDDGIGADRILITVAKTILYTRFGWQFFLIWWFDESCNNRQIIYAHHLSSHLY